MKPHMITNTPNATYWDPGRTPGHDRFFWAAIDGQDVLFVMHPDHSVCIASSQPEAVSSLEEVLSELRGLAA
jgi:hypothetical protein